MAVTENSDIAHGDDFGKVLPSHLMWRCGMKLLEEKLNSAVSLKNILFATDFSEISEKALPYAAAMSLRYGGMVHVAQDPRLRVETPAGMQLSASHGGWNRHQSCLLRSSL